MPFYILHPNELEITKKTKNAVVVDLREPSEYQKYHYPMAVNWPYCEAERWMNCFRKGQIYILYCEHGNISLFVARKLSQRGITAYTVLGGANALQR